MCSAEEVVLPPTPLQTLSSRARVPLGRRWPAEGMLTLRNGWCLEPEEQGRSRECCLESSPCLIRLPSNARPLHSAPSSLPDFLPISWPFGGNFSHSLSDRVSNPQITPYPAPNSCCFSSVELQRLAVVVLHRAGLSWAMCDTSCVPSRCPPSTFQCASQSLG